MSKTFLKKLREDDSRSDFCCNDVSYFTDRGGEADDENSVHGDRRRVRNRDLDEKPERERPLFPRDSDESLLDYYFDVRNEPILQSTFETYPKLKRKRKLVAIKRRR